MLQTHRFLRIVMHLRVETIVNYNENAPSWNRTHIFSKTSSFTMLYKQHFKNIAFYEQL